MSLNQLPIGSEQASMRSIGRSAGRAARRSCLPIAAAVLLLGIWESAGLAASLAPPAQINKPGLSPGATPAPVPMLPVKPSSAPGNSGNPPAPQLPANVLTPPIQATGAPGLPTQITTPTISATGKPPLPANILTPPIQATGAPGLPPQITTPAITATGLVPLPAKAPPPIHGSGTPQ